MLTVLIENVNMNENRKNEMELNEEDKKNREEIRLRDYLIRKTMPLPDVEKELANFYMASKRERKNSNWIYAASCAALFVLGLFVGKMFFVSHPVTPEDVFMAFMADRNNEDVTVRSNKGDVFVLSSHSQEYLDGTNLLYDKAENSINYNRTALDDNSVHVVTTPCRKDINIVLHDGTEVWLNAASQLSYPLIFTDKERVVKLRGEAYFKVSKDADRPFIVLTENLSTEVLGTEFNVRCYSPNDTHVTLLKGAVEVRNVLQTYRKRLVPGQDAFLMPDGDFLVKSVDTRYYTQWKNGYFYFDEVALEDIACELGRWYNVDVIFKNKSAVNIKMHFLANRKGSLADVVELLNSMKKVKVSFTDTQLIIE